MNDLVKAIERAIWEQRYLSSADAKVTCIIRAIDAAGFAIVPKEPTEDMVWKASDARKAAGRMGGVHGQTMDETYKHTFKYELAIYRAMLAAAPDYMETGE